MATFDGLPYESIASTIASRSLTHEKRHSALSGFAKMTLLPPEGLFPASDLERHRQVAAVVPFDVLNSPAQTFPPSRG